MSWFGSRWHDLSWRKADRLWQNGRVELFVFKQTSLAGDLMIANTACPTLRKQAYFSEIKSSNSVFCDRALLSVAMSLCMRGLILSVQLQATFFFLQTDVWFVKDRYLCSAPDEHVTCCFGMVAVIMYSLSSQRMINGTAKPNWISTTGLCLHGIIRLIWVIIQSVSAVGNWLLDPNMRLMVRATLSIFQAVHLCQDNPLWIISTFILLSKPPLVTPP